MKCITGEAAGASGSRLFSMTPVNTYSNSAAALLTTSLVIQSSCRPTAFDSAIATIFRATARKVFSLDWAASLGCPCAMYWKMIVSAVACGRRAS